MTQQSQVTQIGRADRDTLVPKQTRRFHIYSQGSLETASAHLLASILRAANQIAETPLYDVELHDRFTRPTPDFRKSQTVVFIGGVESRWRLGPSTRETLRKIFIGADRIVLVGSAAYLLRDAGLHDRSSLAIHPNFLAPMSEEFPDQQVAAAPTSVQGRVCSAISGLAAQSLFLELLRRDQGEHTARAVGLHLGLEDATTKPAPGAAWKYVQLSNGDRIVCNALKAMSAHIDDPLPIDEIARRVGTSVRQVQRRFKDKTDLSPQAVYRDIRLQYAQNLLSRSDMAVLDVAVASGFQNYTTFVENFKKAFGVSPTRMRNARFFGEETTSERVSAASHRDQVSSSVSSIRANRASISRV